MNEQSQKPKKGLFRKIKPSASTEMSTGNSVLQTDQVTQSAIRLHRSCKTLNVTGFKECFCNQNLDVLIIEGFPSAEELINAWNDIVFEYGCIIKTENSQYLYDLQHRIAELQQHITYVDHAVFLLRKRFNQNAIDELISLGYDGIYQFDDHVQYLRQLDRVVSLCKTRVMDLYELQEEYKKYNVNQTGGSQSEESFEEWMADLGRFQHHPIDQEKTMVIQLAGIINSYIKAHKSPYKQEPANG